MLSKKKYIIKLLAASLAALTLFLAAGCDSDNGAETEAPAPETQAAVDNTAEPPPTPAPNGIEVTVIGNEGMGGELDLAKVQLEKAGFVVSVSVAEDYSGEHELALYSADIEEYADIYNESSKSVIPLYQSVSLQAINTEILMMEAGGSFDYAYSHWAGLAFADKETNAAKPLVIALADGDLGSFDPHKSNAAAETIILNMYIRLLNMTFDGKPTADGSLSYGYVLAGGDIYFALRDDAGFTQISGKHPVDAGVRVGAEDVVYSLVRAGIVDSGDISIVGDISELEEQIRGETIRKTLETGTLGEIRSLTDNKESADNSNGVYQVIKIKTSETSKTLRSLSGAAAGIVCAEHVKSDAAYGLASSIMEGQGYNNTLMVSGPYIAVFMNRSELVLEKNPAFMPGTEHEPRINTVLIKFSDDYASITSELHGGDVHVMPLVPGEALELVKYGNLDLRQNYGGEIVYFTKSSTGSDENLSMALLYSITREAFLDQDLCLPVDSSLSWFGAQAEPEKVNEYLSKYWDAK